MQKNKGIALYIVIIIIAVVLGGVGTGAYFLFKDRESFNLLEESFENAIKDSLANQINKNPDDVNVEVLYRNGIYTTGQIMDKTNGESTYFYAVFAGGVWRVVDAVNGISCERIKALGFAGEGLEGCGDQYKEAKTVAQVASEETSEDEEVVIIGTIEFAGSDIVTVSSGGSSVNVSISGNSNAENGDTVIITGNYVPAPNGEDSVVVATSVEDIGEEDDEIVSSSNNSSSSSSSSSNNSNSLSSSDSSSDSDEDVSEPVTEISEPETSESEVSDSSSGYNIFDLNQSGQIKLLND